MSLNVKIKQIRIFYNFYRPLLEASTEDRDFVNFGIGQHCWAFNGFNLNTVKNRAHSYFIKPEHGGRAGCDCCIPG